MRRRLKSPVISIRPDAIKKAKVSIRAIKAAEIEPTETPLFPGSAAQSSPRPTSTPIRSFSPKAFWVGAGGGFSKRAFFFSLFACAAFVYLVICIIGLVDFDDKLGLFILGCNAAFGLNYYKNERDRVGNGQ